MLDVKVDHTNVSQYLWLNGAYVVPDSSNTAEQPESWRRTEPAENPVWGWVVVDHLTHSVLAFLPDGTWHREINSDGTSRRAGTSISSKTTQLDRFLDKLARSRSYLKVFLEIVRNATNHDPSIITYIALALTNLGLSLESRVPVEPGFERAVSLGRVPWKHQSVDGLIGYFLERPSSQWSDHGCYVFDQMSTHYNISTKNNKGSHMRRLGDERSVELLHQYSPESILFEVLEAFYFDPDNYSGAPYSGPFTDEYKKAWDSKMTVYGAIVDLRRPVFVTEGSAAGIALNIHPESIEAALANIRTTTKVRTQVSAQRLANQGGPLSCCLS